MFDDRAPHRHTRARSRRLNVRHCLPRHRYRWRRYVVGTLRTTLQSGLRRPPTTTAALQRSLLHSLGLLGVAAWMQTMLRMVAMERVSDV